MVVAVDFMKTIITQGAHFYIGKLSLDMFI